VAKTRKQLRLEQEAAERARQYAEQTAAAAKQAEEARKAKEEQLKAGNSFETAEVWLGVGWGWVGHEQRGQGLKGVCTAMSHRLHSNTVQRSPALGAVGGC
jgi:hypothetical protein